MEVRQLRGVDVDAVVRRVGSTLARDARRCELVNPDFDRARFADALRDARDQTWVAWEDERVIGHLYGALLTNDEYGTGAWIGPDGVSFERADVLEHLYTTASATWITAGASEHYAWVFDDAPTTAPWYDLGFSRAHHRGVFALTAMSRRAVPPPYRLRRGGSGDLELAVAFDALLDEAQREGTGSVATPAPVAREEMLELLEDPDVTYYVVELDGVGVAQCLAFPLAGRRGSFPSTLHLSAVAVRPTHQRRGLGRALIDAVLDEAAGAGYTHAEVNWRATNRRADAFWRGYGFTATYVRLRRSATR